MYIDNFVLYKLYLSALLFFMPLLRLMIVFGGEVEVGSIGF